MPTITLIGSALVMAGVICIAFTPREKIVIAPIARFGTLIAVVNADGTEATSAEVPYAEDGKVLAWDSTKNAYRWVSK